MPERSDCYSLGAGRTELNSLAIFYDEAHLGNFADLLPVLDIEEASAVGGTSLLPSRIMIDSPSQKPDSATIKFGDEWCREDVPDDIGAAVLAMKKQGR